VKKGSKLYIEGALQTRKWTDQSGVEKYSTEVVLQGFNGTLTMLDSAGGGRGSSIGMQEGGADYGSDGGFGSSSGMEPRRGKAGSGAKAGFDSTIDDEIPF
jgi:single-strand DNA-binding protein